MIRLRLVAFLVALPVSGALAEEPKKPDAPKTEPAKPAAAKPVAPGKAATPKPAAKPAPSKGDLALAAARKCDTDKNGTVTGGEVTGLRLAFRDPKNFLDLFDDNGNGYLDDQEVSKLNAKLKPPKPAEPRSGSKASSSKAKASKEKKEK